MGFKDLKEAVQDGNTNSTNDAGGDYESYPLVKLFPETVLSFDEVSDLWKSENQWGVSIGFNLVNPRAITLDDVVSEVYMSNGKTVGDISREDDEAVEYIDYQVMNPEDGQFDKDFDQNGTLKSVTGGHPQTGDYEGHQVERLDADEVSIYMSGSTGNTIARTLDSNGLLGADYDDETGEHNNGLIEWNPKNQQEDVSASDLDELSVFTREPELREDLDWETNDGGFIAMLWEDYKKSYNVILGYNDFDGDNMEAATLIDPTVNNDGFDDPDLKWHTPPLDEKSSAFEDGTAGNFSDASSSDDTADEEEDSTHITYESAPTEIKEVAHHAVVGMELRPGTDPLEQVTDQDAWLHMVEQTYDGNETVDAEFGDMVATVVMDYARLVDGDFATARDAGFSDES